MCIEKVALTAKKKPFFTSPLSSQYLNMASFEKAIGVVGGQASDGAPRGGTSGHDTQQET